MIRILHVLNWLVRGGFQTLLLRVLRDCDRSRFHMDVCCAGEREGDLADEARSYGAKIHMCRRSADLFSFSRRLARLLGKHCYQKVHSHFAVSGGAILRGARLAGVPVRVLHVHSVEPTYQFSSRSPVARAGLRLLSSRDRMWA